MLNAVIKKLVAQGNLKAAAEKAAALPNTYTPEGAKAAREFTVSAWALKAQSIGGYEKLVAHGFVTPEMAIEAL